MRKLLTFVAFSYVALSLGNYAGVSPGEAISAVKDTVNHVGEHNKLYTAGATLVLAVAGFIKVRALWRKLLGREQTSKAIDAYNKAVRARVGKIMAKANRTLRKGRRSFVVRRLSNEEEDKLKKLFASRGLTYSRNSGYDDRRHGVRVNIGFADGANCISDNEDLPF